MINAFAMPYLLLVAGGLFHLPRNELQNENMPDKFLK